MSLLWLSAASPLFLYSPSSLIPDTLQGRWNDILSQGQPAGAGDQTASTLQQSGAVLLPSIYSTGFTPVFSPQTGWNVSLTVNSEPAQPWAPGQAWRGDKLDPNTFLLQFQCTGDCSANPITFGGATISTEHVANGAQEAEAVLDDGTLGPDYSGNFTAVGAGSNATVAVTSEDNAGTLSWTGTSGASVSVSFHGSAIAAYGVTAPTLGSIGIWVDGNRVSTLSANSDVEGHGVLLYYTTQLNPGIQHTMMLEALDVDDGQVGFVVDRWQAWGPQGQANFVNTTQTPSSSSTIPPQASDTLLTPPPAGPLTNGTAAPPPPGAAVDNSGPNVGAIVGGIIGGLAGLALLYIMFRQVHKALKPEEKKLNPWDEANMLQNVKNEGVHVTTIANQRYVYPGMIAHSKLR